MCGDQVIRYYILCSFSTKHTHIQISFSLLDHYSVICKYGDFICDICLLQHNYIHIAACDHMITI